MSKSHPLKPALGSPRWWGQCELWCQADLGLDLGLDLSDFLCDSEGISLSFILEYGNINRNLLESWQSVPWVAPCELYLLVPTHFGLCLWVILTNRT